MKTATKSPAATPTATPHDVIDLVYRDAVRVSVESRTLVRIELDDPPIAGADPAANWSTLLATRALLPGRLDAAARILARLAGGELRPYVRRGAKNLRRAVEDLAAWRPRHERRADGPDGRDERWGWVPTAESVGRLDELRQAVRVRLLELASLFEEHETALDRVLAVAREVAAVVLEPTAAAVVVRWCEKLQAAETA